MILRCFAQVSEYIRDNHGEMSRSLGLIRSRSTKRHVHRLELVRKRVIKADHARRADAAAPARGANIGAHVWSIHAPCIATSPYWSQSRDEMEHARCIVV